MTATVWRIEHGETGQGPFQDKCCPYAWNECDCPLLHLDQYKPGEWTQCGMADLLEGAGFTMEDFTAGCLTLHDLRTWFTYPEVEDLAGHGYVLAGYSADELVEHEDTRQVAFTGTRVTVREVWELYPLGWDPDGE